MDECKNTNIIEKDNGIHVYISPWRFYAIACFLSLCAIALIGALVVMYCSMPRTFPRFWSHESMVYLGVTVLGLYFIFHQFRDLMAGLKQPQMIIGPAEVKFKRNSKGGPLLTAGFIILKYKEIISISCSSVQGKPNTLTFLTSTQLYQVGLVLEKEEKAVVYQIIRARVGGHEGSEVSLK